MLIRALLFLSFFVVAAISAQAQLPTRSKDDPALRTTQQRNSPLPSNGDLGTPEDEMRARNDIKIAEKERQENLDRANEASTLAREIRQAYSKNKTLSSSDMKKLERLEKLTRRIRSHAGGSDDDEPLDNVPAQLEAAFIRLADTSEALSKDLEKTPKMVISASVIDRANELLEIIHFIRTNLR